MLKRNLPCHWWSYLNTDPPTMALALREPTALSEAYEMFTNSAVVMAYG